MKKKLRKVLSALLSVCMLVSFFLIGSVPASADLVNHPAQVNDGYVAVEVTTTVYLSSNDVYIDVATSGYSVGSGYPVSFLNEAMIVLNCAFPNIMSYGTEIAYGYANGTTYDLSG
ncbi:MAG: hypothetical protein IIZ66_08210, partial [Clostridia bacterium]|nr:hypothetical protein [Clostridia bacterium]